VAFAHTLLRKFKNSGAPLVSQPISSVLVACAFVSIFLGTIVTGTGPHSGDKNVSSRFEFDLATVANFHAKSIWIYCAILAILIWKKLKAASQKTRRSVLILVAIVLSQGFLGYYQYFAGVPEILVFIHIIGSVLFWIANLRVRADLAQDKSV
jgi:cytochrome c oxidase assembly protein subunit 15